MRRLAPLVFALLAGGCVRRIVVPCPDVQCGCAQSIPKTTEENDDIAPKLRPANCPDDGIHVVVNGICVDTNGK